MKTKNKIILWIIGICAGWVIFSYILTPAWWYFQQLVDPHYYQRVRQTWEAQNKSSKFLVRQLESRNVVYNGVAGTLLAIRKDPNTIQPLIKILQTSKDEDVRRSPIGILNQFDDPRVTEAFMKIVKSGKNHPDYLYVVDAFALKHKDFIYPEILSMAKDNFHTAYVVDMLAEFPDRPETLPALQKIADSDPKDYIREKALKALDQIKTK